MLTTRFSYATTRIATADTLHTSSMDRNRRLHPKKHCAPSSDEGDDAFSKGCCPVPQKRVAYPCIHYKDHISYQYV